MKRYTAQQEVIATAFAGNIAIIVGCFLLLIPVFFGCLINMLFIRKKGPLSATSWD